MEKKKVITKAIDTLWHLFSALSVIQWLIAIIFPSGTTITVVVIMPSISPVIIGIIAVIVWIILFFSTIYALGWYNLTKHAKISESDIPKIKVLDAKIHSQNIVGLRVKNVGARGEIRVSVVNNEGIKARWFKSYREMKDIGGKEKIKLAREDECYVGITRRGVIGIRSDIGSHQTKVRFHEANQIFEYKFRITEGGIEDLEFLGELEKGGTR